MSELHSRCPPSAGGSAHQREQPQYSAAGPARPSSRSGWRPASPPSRSKPYVGVPLLDAGVEATFAVRRVQPDPRGLLRPGRGARPVDLLVVLWRIEDMFGAAPGAGCGRRRGRRRRHRRRRGRARQHRRRRPPERPASRSSCRSRRSPADRRRPGRLGRRPAARPRCTLRPSRRSSPPSGDAPVRWADLNAWQLAMGIDQSHDVVKAMVYRQPYTTAVLARASAGIWPTSCCASPGPRPSASCSTATTRCGAA